MHCSLVSACSGVGQFNIICTICFFFFPSSISVSLTFLMIQSKDSHKYSQRENKTPIKFAVTYIKHVKWSCLMICHACLCQITSFLEENRSALTICVSQPLFLSVLPLSRLLLWEGDSSWQRHASQAWFFKVLKCQGCRLYFCSQYNIIIIIIVYNKKIRLILLWRTNLTHSNVKKKKKWEFLSIVLSE